MYTTVNSVEPVAPLELIHKPDAFEAQQRMRAFWAGEMIDRPPVAVTAPKSGASAPYRSLVAPADFDFDRAVDEFEEWASGIFFGGESFPALGPWWGPDQWAGFMGADITLMPEHNTSWIKPPINDWDDFPTLGIDPDNKWWKGILDYTKTAAQRCDGKFILSTIDTHSNADCLSALRDPSALCMDLIEHPDEVKRAIRQVDALYLPVYDAVYHAGRMSEFGSTSWSAMWSDGKTQTVQCDFCYLISQEHFREFVLPSLEYEISCLDHAIYHLDGIGELRHLDDLLAIPNLHTIQWIPGAGQPQAPEWIELLQRIQKAGKSVQVYSTVEEAKAVHPHLEPHKTFYLIPECESETKARELIHWLEVMT